MRRIAALACVVALPALVDGQSLGEVARHEKERREKARAASPAPPAYTEESLASAKGRLVNSAVGKAAPPPSPSASRTGGADDALRADQEEYWRSRAAQARARVAAAQADYDALDRQIRFGQAGSRDANGRRVIYSAQAMKEMADRAQAELAAAKKALDDVFEDARRAGALPGWLR